MLRLEQKPKVRNSTLNPVRSSKCDRVFKLSSKTSDTQTAEDGGAGSVRAASNIDKELWNERTEDRTNVLHHLKDVIKHKLDRDHVPPAFWAFCQVADLSKLEEMVFAAESTSSRYLAKMALVGMFNSSDMAISQCEFSPILLIVKYFPN
jgi:hypothetical protein